MVPLGLWVRFSAQSVTTGTGHVPALAALSAGVAWLLALSGWATPAGGPLGRWLPWADLPLLGPDPSTGYVLLVTGVVLVTSRPPTSSCASSSSAWARCVRCSARGWARAAALRPAARRAAARADGAHPHPRARPRRSATAAGLVIAAKGLIRFPELQSKRDDATTVEAVGIDEVTEYFLVGSFVSWLVALLSLALTR